MSSNTVFDLSAPSGWKPTAGRPRSDVGSSDRRRPGAASSACASRAMSGRRSMKRSTTRGIERAAGFLLQQQQRGLVRHRLVVRAIRRERVEVVHDRQDAGAERDVIALQPLRIALAIPSLVVAEDERRHRVRERHRADDLGADLRVNANLLELFLGERTRLREDVLGHGQLADVVEQRRGLDALNLVVGHAQRAGQPGGVDLHAADVRLRGLILGVDGERQRLDRGQMQVGHLLDVPALVVDPAQVDLVGAVGEVERGNRQEASQIPGRHDRPMSPPRRRRRRRNSWARSTGNSRSRR